MRFFIILLLILSSLNAQNSYKGTNELLSAYIYLLSKNVSWSDKTDSNTFDIVILEEELSIYNTFTEMSEGLTLKGRPIKLYHADVQAKINFNKCDVLFVSKEYEAQMENIYKTIGTRQVLLISHESERAKYNMINIYEDKKSRLNIEININNIQTHGLDISDEVLLSGSSKVGVGKLYHTSIVAMRQQEEKYKEYQELNKKLKKNLNQYKLKIESLNADIAGKVEKYNATVEAIELKERKINDLKQEMDKHKIDFDKKIKNQKIYLQKYKDQLAQKMKDLEVQKENLKKYTEILNEKLQTIHELDKTIQKHKQVIKENEIVTRKQKEEIVQQQNSLYLIGLIAFLLMLFLIYIYKSRKKYVQISKELEIAENIANQANQAKSMFISKMSHELRTPLNAILGFSDILLQNKKYSRADKKALQTINSSGVFLLAMINDILDISSIESNKVKTQFEGVNIKYMIEDIFLLIGKNADVKSLKLIKEYDENLVECIRSDSKMLKQIILNLATNAIKYTQKGQVTFRVRTSNNSLFVEVEDTGDGISKDELALVFEPFKQVGGASISTGHGLGLAIVKQYMDVLGGKITIESEVDKGTTFFIELPYTDCNKDEIRTLNKSRSSNQIMSVAQGSQKIKILIAEDNENNIHLLEKILEILPCEIQIARDGKEAVEINKQLKPDLIFMDNRMPVMDGLEAIKQIRMDAANEKLTIALLSADIISKKQEEDIGADYYLLKPYNKESIYSLLEENFKIDFIYEEDDSTKPEHNISMESFENELKSLNPDILEELYSSALLLNKEDMQDVLHKIKQKNPILYGQIQKLIEELNYLQIITTINTIS
jgi:signal transduction histidine kinase/CheY-like chemotaxis protein